MTMQDMLDALGLRLEDPLEGSFEESSKLAALNEAQRTVAELAHLDYLQQLQVVTSAVSATLPAGSPTYQIDVSGYTFYGPGITALYDMTNQRFVRQVTPEAEQLFRNTYLTPTNEDPAWYLLTNTIHIRTTVSGRYKIHYLTTPSPIYATDSASCQISADLHDVILDFAESLLWRQDNQLQRAAVAEQAGQSHLQALNAKKGDPIFGKGKTQKPQGIGSRDTKGVSYIGGNNA